MKSLRTKKLLLLAAIMIVVTAGSAVLTKALNSNNDKGQDAEFTIVTSFYPLYIAAQNVADGMEHIDVVNLMQNQQGCLHDYQLTTENMRTLEKADVLIINGAGMEAFLDDIKTSYPDLPIIDTSKGIDLIHVTGEVHDHDHDHEDAHEEEAEHDHEEETDHDHEEEAEEGHDHDHEESEYNPHMWLDPERYEKQVDTIAEGLATLDSANAARYASNAKAYNNQVAKINQELKALPAFDYNKVILFHNSMEYLCQALGIEVSYCLNLDGESSLSAGEIATIIEEVKENDIKVLFSEEQYSDSVANRIGEETGANVYVFDSLVTGVDDPDAYLTGMRNNIELLKKALYK